jgi:hypothetical protein
MANKINVFPKEAVEGLIGESIGSIHESFMMLIMKPKELSQIDNARASWLVTKSEIARVLECLSPYSDASLQPKHCSARDVYNEMAKRMELTSGIQDAKNTRNKNATQFARDLTEFMKTIHVVMHKDTNYVDRVAQVEMFVGDLVDAEISSKNNYIAMEVADA